MKKTVFALLAVLLVLMLATCDLFEQPLPAESNLPLVTDDGRAMVELTINVGDGGGTSRALSLAQAAGIDYWEVAFRDPGYNGTTNTTIYRGIKPASGTWKIAIPAPASYTGAANAVLLAGKSGSPNILLAIGVITLVTDSGAGNNTTGAITMTTDSVTFTLSALRSSFDATNVVDSSIRLMGPTTVNSTNYTTVIQSEPANAGVNEYPKLPVPAHGHTSAMSPPGAIATDIIVRYTVHCGAVSGAVGSKVGAADANFAGLVVANTTAYSTVAYNSSGVVAQVTPFAPAANAAVPTTGIFDFFVDVSTTSADGLTQMYIKAPVYALGSGNAPTAWVIQNGLNNAAYEDLLASDPAGALFLLDVGGNPNKRSVEIIIGGAVQ